MEEDNPKQGTNELAIIEQATSELTPELSAEVDFKLADSVQSPDNLDLPAETSLVLAPCEQAYNEDVNLTQPPSQSSNSTLREQCYKPSISRLGWILWLII